MSDIKNAFSANKLAISEREDAFASLRKLITRTKNYYASSGSQAVNVEDANSFAKKIQGVRAKPVAKSDPTSPETVTSFTSSQQS